MLRDGTLPRTSRPLSPSTGWTQSSSAAAAALTPSPVSIHAGFQYATRAGLFDWRTLHGINIEAVVRSVNMPCGVDWERGHDMGHHPISATERGHAHAAWMDGCHAWISAWPYFAWGGQHRLAQHLLLTPFARLTPPFL